MLHVLYIMSVKKCKAICSVLYMECLHVSLPQMSGTLGALELKAFSHVPS